MKHVCDVSRNYIQFKSIFIDAEFFMEYVSEIYYNLKE